MVTKAARKCAPAAPYLPGLSDEDDDQDNEQEVTAPLFQPGAGMPAPPGPGGAKLSVILEGEKDDELQSSIDGSASEGDANVMDEEEIDDEEDAYYDRGGECFIDLSKKRSGRNPPDSESAARREVLSILKDPPKGSVGEWAAQVKIDFASVNPGLSVNDVVCPLPIVDLKPLRKRMASTGVVEIASDRVKFLNPAWPAMIEKATEECTRALLGARFDAATKAKLRGVLLCAPGGDWWRPTAPKKGSPISQVFATMAFHLPCATPAEGGGIRLEHETLGLKHFGPASDAFALSCCAFFSSFGSKVRFSVPPIIKGLAVVLLYDIECPPSVPLPSFQGGDSSLAGAHSALGNALKKLTRKVVLPLSGSYSSSDLEQRRLTPIDAEICRQLAASKACDVCLGFIEKEEKEAPYEDSNGSSWGGYSRRWDYDDDFYGDESRVIVTWKIVDLVPLKGRLARAVAKTSTPLPLKPKEMLGMSMDTVATSRIASRPGYYGQPAPKAPKLSTATQGCIVVWPLRTAFDQALEAQRLQVLSDWVQETMENKPRIPELHRIMRALIAVNGFEIEMLSDVLLREEESEEVTDLAVRTLERYGWENVAADRLKMLSDINPDIIANLLRNVQDPNGDLVKQISLLEALAWLPKDSLGDCIMSLVLRTKHLGSSSSSSSSGGVGLIQHLARVLEKPSLSPEHWAKIVARAPLGLVQKLLNHVAQRAPVVLKEVLARTLDTSVNLDDRVELLLQFCGNEALGFDGEFLSKFIEQFGEELDEYRLGNVLDSALARKISKFSPKALVMIVKRTEPISMLLDVEVEGTEALQALSDRIGNTDTSASGEATAPLAAKPPLTPAVYHPGVSCDGCQSLPQSRAMALCLGHMHPTSGYIQGIRYHSSARTNFDLCESCYASPLFANDAPHMKADESRMVKNVLPRATSVQSQSTVIEELSDVEAKARLISMHQAVMPKANELALKLLDSLAPGEIVGLHSLVAALQRAQPPVDWLKLIEKPMLRVMNKSTDRYEMKLASLLGLAVDATWIETAVVCFFNEHCSDWATANMGLVARLRSRGKWTEPMRVAWAECFFKRCERLDCGDVLALLEQCPEKIQRVASALLRWPDDRLAAMLANVPPAGSALIEEFIVTASIEKLASLAPELASASLSSGNSHALCKAASAVAQWRTRNANPTGSYETLALMDTTTCPNKEAAAFFRNPILASMDFSCRRKMDATALDYWIRRNAGDKAQTRESVFQQSASTKKWIVHVSKVNIELRNAIALLRAADAALAKMQQALSKMPEEEEGEEASFFMSQ